MKRWKFILGSLTLVILGFSLGVYLGGKNLFKLGTSKMITQVDADYVSVQGEMAALDFKPGLRPRIIKMICTRENEKKLCTIAEVASFSKSNYGILDLQFLYDSGFVRWNKDEIIYVSNEGTFTRTMHLDIRNKSLTDTYRYGNGEVRTTKLVGSYDMLGYLGSK